jgi:hypothetical protein
LIGFLFDGIKRTVRLPAMKVQTYIKETHTILRQKTISLKSLQAIAGRLRHLSVILPVAKGFFTPINTALRGNPKNCWPWGVFGTPRSTGRPHLVALPSQHMPDSHL